MLEILALTIVCQWWMLLALITVASILYPALHKWEDCSGDYICFPDFVGLFKIGGWFVGNLIMWLIYFIIV